jgi:hypothetical protein
MFRIKSKVFGIENFTVYASKLKPTGPRNVFTLRTIYGTILHEFEVNELKLETNLLYCILCRGSAVGISTGRPRVGFRVPVGSTIFTFPYRPYRLSDPSSLLSNGYRGIFPREKSGSSVKLTTHLQLLLRSRKRGSITSTPPYAFTA